MDNQGAQLYAVCYSPVDSSLLGRIWIAARASGICFLDFSETEADFIDGLNEVLDSFPGEAEVRLDPTNLSLYLEALLAYFDEHKPIPDDLPTQIGFLTEFQCEVLKIVKGIPMGSVLTYGELARQLGKPQAARAVGQVLRANPLPVIIPCHRVVRSDGSVGGYGGILGSERKIALLKHEGVILA